MPLKEDPPAIPPVAAPTIVRGWVEVKTKRIFGRDKWVKAMCEYNPAARKLSCTDSTGKEWRAMDCWLVDVANRYGKRQHRFDIESDGSQRPMALAVEGIEEKQRWVAAVETKEALRARQEQARREQELMVEHGESTIEEAQRQKQRGGGGGGEMVKVVVTSNVAKYRVGQKVQAMGGGAVNGFIIQVVLHDPGGAFEDLATLHVGPLEMLQAQQQQQRKEAKAAQGQKEEEDCVTSVVWDTSMNTIAGIESTPSASLKFMPLRERSDSGVSIEEKMNAPYWLRTDDTATPVENVPEVSEGPIT
jgi:hypothetical protein